MKKILFLLVGAALLVSCGRSPKVEGLYTYEHAFSYDMNGNHLEVHETGTMDFNADGFALDSARQVYVATLADGGTATWVYNYISPSRWRVEGDYLYFAGVKEGFRMEAVEGDCGLELVRQIAGAYSRSAGFEYKFHVDTLTASLLQWSYTYPDGHSDTWRFNR